MSLETIKTTKTQRHPGSFQANAIWELIFERHPSHLKVTEWLLNDFSMTPKRLSKDIPKMTPRHPKKDNGGSFSVEENYKIIDKMLKQLTSDFAADSRELIKPNDKGKIMMVIAQNNFS